MKVVIITVFLMANIFADNLTIRFFGSDGFELKGDKVGLLKSLNSKLAVSFLIENNSSDDFVIWKPYTPKGDRAIKVEVKEVGSKKILGYGKVSMMYTGMSKKDQSTIILPNSGLILRRDFLNYWKFNFELSDYSGKILEWRVLYQNSSTEDKSVYVGEVKSDWVSAQLKL